MSERKLMAVLEARGIEYEVLPHRPAFSAQQTAAALHVHGREFAKTIVIHANGRSVMAVVPAHLRLDLGKMMWLAGGTSFELVPEPELAELFPDDELGAMSPAGNFLGIPMIVDRQLMRQPHIVFNAGSHAEAIRMQTKDFVALMAPTIADISMPAEPPAYSVSPPHPRPARP